MIEVVIHKDYFYNTYINFFNQYDKCIYEKSWFRKAHETLIIKPRTLIYYED